MKKMWPVFVILILTLGLLWIAAPSAIAQDQCEVAGNSYTATIGVNEWTLTFAETSPQFSPAPRCAGDVYFVSPTDTYILKWLLSRNGTLIIAGLPAVLTSYGIEIYGIPSNLYSLRIGNVVYKTASEVQSFLFK